jgi:hypothetical protein
MVWDSKWFSTWPAAARGWRRVDSDSRGLAETAELARADVAQVSTHTVVMMREFGGTGWAIYDAATGKKVKQQIGIQTRLFQRLQLIYLFTAGHRKSRSLDTLARKNGIDPVGLRRTVDAHNQGLASGAEDSAPKDRSSARLSRRGRSTRSIFRPGRRCSFRFPG